MFFNVFYLQINVIIYGTSVYLYIKLSHRID